MSVFEILREQVPLDLLVSTNGSGKARCVSPHHQDTNPSMHRYDKHVHCYRCGFHDDVVAVWAAMRGFDRPIDAALDLAGEYGIKLPEISSEARKKAEERRNKEQEYLNQAQACHRALEKHERTLLAALFTRYEPYRRGVLEGKAIAEDDRGPDERGVGGGHR